MVEGLFFFLKAGLDLLGPALDGLLELGEAMLVCIELHVLLGLDEGRDELTASLTHKI